jgi:hypothetical protein
VKELVHVLRKVDVSRLLNFVYLSLSFVHCLFSEASHMVESFWVLLLRILFCCLTINDGASLGHITVKKSTSLNKGLD